MKQLFEENGILDVFDLQGGHGLVGGDHGHGANTKQLLPKGTGGADVADAVKQDVLVVCAAGNNGDCNDNTEELDYPGAYSEVIEVGAVNLERKITCFSNSNQEIDLVAPGDEILSTYPDGKYAVLSGTSMATPHVAGALALLIKQCEKEYGRKLSEPEIYAQLIKRTVPLGYERTSEGNGLLDLLKE